jgi:membrane protein
MLKGAGSTSSGLLSGVVGVVCYFAAALGVVVQLKDALNVIWETKGAENVGVWWYCAPTSFRLPGFWVLVSSLPCL